MQIEFVNLPSDLNEHIYSFVQGQTARENYNRVIQDIKNSYDSQMDKKIRYDPRPRLEFQYHFKLEETFCLKQTWSDEHYVEWISISDQALFHEQNKQKMQRKQRIMMNSLIFRYLFIISMLHLLW